MLENEIKKLNKLLNQLMKTGKKMQLLTKKAKVLDNEHQNLPKLS